MDERIRAIRTKFVTLIVILAIGWQAASSYRARSLLFRSHQVLTAAYILTSGGNRDFFGNDFTAGPQEGWDWATLYKDKPIADYVMYSVLNQFEFIVVLPGPGVMHVEMKKVGHASIECAFSFGAPVELQGQITLIRDLNGEPWGVVTPLGTRTLTDERRKAALREVAYQLGVDEENPRESIRKVRTSWDMHRDRVPVLGVSVSATHAVLVAFALAIAVTMLISSNARHAASLEICDRKEPWLLLDTGARSHRAQAALARLLHLVQDVLERCAIAVYYAVTGLGAAAMGVLGIVTILESQASYWWIVPMCLGIVVSLASGLLAVSSMMRTRRTWRSTILNDPLKTS